MSLDRFISMTLRNIIAKGNSACMNGSQKLLNIPTNLLDLVNFWADAAHFWPFSFGRPGHTHHRVPGRRSFTNTLVYKECLDTSDRWLASQLT